MADTNVPVVSMTVNTASAANPAGTSVALNDTATIRDGKARLLLIRLTAGVGGGTVTFQAGDKPPASQASRGNLVVTLGASETKFVQVECARFMHTDTVSDVPTQQIRAVVTTAAVTFTPFKLDKNA